MDPSAFEHSVRLVERHVNKRLVPGAVLLPGDARRRRFAVLLVESGTSEPVSFAKYTVNPPNHLARAARRLLASDPADVWVPQPLVSGSVDGWTFDSVSVLPALRHYPARLRGEDLHATVGWMQRMLVSLREGDAVPVHGDFGPWNVRRLADGRLAIIDWEDCRLGPPASDEIWYLVTCAKLRISGMPTSIRDIADTLRSFHGSIAIEAAVEALRSHVLRPQPAEVGDDELPVGVRKAQQEYSQMLDGLALAASDRRTE